MVSYQACGRTVGPTVRHKEVDDELWAAIEPLLPKVVLHSAISWEHLPQEPGFGSGMTCSRRLPGCSEAGVWPRLHEAPVAKLRSANALDFSRAAVDGSHNRALKEGQDGPKPVLRVRDKRGRPPRSSDMVLGDRGDHVLGTQRWPV